MVLSKKDQVDRIMRNFTGNHGYREACDRGERCGGARMNVSTSEDVRAHRGPPQKDPGCPHQARNLLSPPAPLRWVPGPRYPWLWNVFRGAFSFSSHQACCFLPGCILQPSSRAAKRSWFCCMCAEGDMMAGFIVIRTLDEWRFHAVICLQT